MVFNNRRLISTYKEMDFLKIRHYGLKPTNMSNESKNSLANERNLVQLLSKSNKRIDANDNNQLLHKTQEAALLTSNKRYLNLSQLSRYSQREETSKEFLLNAKSYRTIIEETPQLVVNYNQQQQLRKKVPSLHNEKPKIMKGLSLRDPSKPLPKLNEEMILTKRIDETNEDHKEKKFSLKKLFKKK